MIKWDKFYRAPCLVQEECEDSGKVIEQRFCKSLDVYPESGYTDIGGTAPFKAVLTYSDETSEDVTSLATWTCSGIGVIDANGNFISSESGISTVNAAYCDLVGSASITVVGSCLSAPVDWVAACCKSSIMDSTVHGLSLFEWQSAAVKAMFLNIKENDRAGAVSYSGIRTSMGGTVSYAEDGQLISGLNEDHLAAYLPVASLSPNNPCLFPDSALGPSSRCNIQIIGGLRAAWDELKSPRHRNDASRMIVLFVFGKDTVASDDAYNLAQTIKMDGIRIAVISLNTPIGYVETLKGIATCGLFFPVDDPNLIIQAVQELPQMICYGYASYCYMYGRPASRGDDTGGPPETSELAGLRWELPCAMPTNWSGCPCLDMEEKSAIMGGSDGIIYDVTLRIRGVAELKSIIGGTKIPVTNLYSSLNKPGVNKNGNPEEALTGGFNRYSLEVSSPAATYWLNEGISPSGSSVSSVPIRIDYEFTLQIEGGATVTLRANSKDGLEFKNIANLTIPDIAPFPSVFDGQFLQMTPVSAVPV